MASTSRRNKIIGIAAGAAVAAVGVSISLVGGLLGSRRRKADEAEDVAPAEEPARPHW